MGSRNIFEANRWHDGGEWTVENEDSSDIIHVGDEDERDLDGDMEEDDDEEDEDDDDDEEEEEEEDIDMLSDEPSMQDFFNSYPASLMERDISDFEHLFPLLNQNRDGRSSHLRVFTGGSYGLSSNSSYGARRDEISMQHPLLVPSRSIDSSHRSRLLDSIFNNAEAAFRNNNISRSPMQILRSLGVTIPPFLVSRIRQWLESGQLTTSHLEYAFGFEERLISSLITESAKEKREAIFSDKEKEKEEKEKEKLDDKKEDKKFDIEESQSSEISSNTEIPIPTIPSNYTQEESENIKSICSLSKEQQEKSMNFSIKLLKQKLDPSLSQAILQLVNLLTRNLEQAINFMENDGLNLLFHLPKASNFNALPTILVHILRHIIDDLPTLQISMEREIGLFLKHIIPNNEETLTPKAFLGTFSHLVHRNVDVFISAASNCCEINSAISMKVTRLTEQQQVQEDTSSSKIKSKKKKPIFITKNKIESKNSEGLIKIIPMVAQSLINLVEYHKKKENSSIEDEYIVGALTLPNLISFLQEFTEGYESCSKLLTNDKEFLDKLTVSNFIGYLLQNVLPHPVELLTERSSNIEKFHHLSNFFVALWNNPQSRPLILTEISNSLKSLLNEQKESEDSYFATIEQLCSLIGLADLITSLLDTSVVFDDTANDRAKLPDLILESEIISKFVDSLDIVDLDRKEASRVFQRLLPALDAAIHVVISRSNSVKNSTDSLLSKEPSLNDSSRNIFEANRWHDVGEWTVENEDSSDIIHVGDEDERDLDGDMEEDDDEEDEDDDEEEEEEEEEDIDMLSDEPSMQDFFNSYP